MQFKSKNEYSEQQKKSNKLFVGGVSNTVSDQDLQHLFSQYGELVSALVVRDRNSISRGFAYVEFARQEYAQIAIENLNQTKFKGRTITVRYAEK